MIGALLLDPFGIINSELLGPSTQRTVTDPLFFRFRFGANVHLLIARGELQTPLSLPQGLVGVLLVSGVPWNRQSTYDTPLSYFDLRADLIFPFKMGLELFLRGMIVGDRDQRASVRITHVLTAERLRPSKSTASRRISPPLARHPSSASRARLRRPASASSDPAALPA